MDNDKHTCGDNVYTIVRDDDSYTEILEMELIGLIRRYCVALEDESVDIDEITEDIDDLEQRVRATHIYN